MTSIGTRFYTWRFGERVGEDSFGNQYYRHKNRDLDERWVVFPGSVEASAVPPAKPATTRSWCSRRTLRAFPFITVSPIDTWPSTTNVQAFFPPVPATFPANPQDHAERFASAPDWRFTRRSIMRKFRNS